MDENIYFSQPSKQANPSPIAKVMTRLPNSKEVPVSDPRTWVEMEEHTDGKEAMRVVNDLVEPSSIF